MNTAEALLDLARHQLRQDPTLRLYCLFDASAHHELPAKLWELIPSPSYAAILTDLVEDTCVALAGPWLVEASADGAWMVWFAELLVEHAGGCLLASKSPLDSLARELGHRVHTVLPGGSAGYFRFYDPRTLLSYWNVTKDAERSWFLGSVETVWGVDLLSAAPFELTHPSLPKPAPAEYIPQLEQAQLDAMARHNEPFHIIQYLDDNHPEALGVTTRRTLLVSLHQNLLPRLDRLRITDAQSRLMFILLYLSHPGSLDDHLLSERPWEAREQTFARWTEMETLVEQTEA